MGLRYVLMETTTGKYRSVIEQIKNDQNYINWLMCAVEETSIINHDTVRHSTTKYQVLNMFLGIRFLHGSLLIYV